LRSKYFSNRQRSVKCKFQVFDRTIPISLRPGPREQFILRV
jgi:hypothetical protein